MISQDLSNRTRPYLSPVTRKAYRHRYRLHLCLGLISTLTFNENVNSKMRRKISCFFFFFNNILSKNNVRDLAVSENKRFNPRINLIYIIVYISIVMLFVVG